MIKTLTVLTLLLTCTACTTKQLGQAAYDSAKTEECRRQGINHCDPYAPGTTEKPTGEIAPAQNAHSNQALEAQAKKIINTPSK